MAQMTGEEWVSANWRYLEAELARLRALLRRRVLWLQKQWKHENYRPWVIAESQADSLLEGNDRVGESQFYAQAPAAEQICLALTQAEEQASRRRRELSDAGSPAAIDVLARLYGLSPFERDTLLLCVAPELDSTFELLYAYAQDDATRRYATAQLALTLLAPADEGWPFARQAFLSDSPLRRYGLLKTEPVSGVAGAISSQPLRLDERIVGYVLGINYLDERAAAVLRPVPPALLPASHGPLVDDLTRWLRSESGQASWKALNLVGHPDSGKLVLARALCDRLKINLYILDLTRVPQPLPERRELFGLLEREAVLLQMALYFDLDSARVEENQLLNSDLERLAAFVIVGSREPWPMERDLLTLRVVKADASSQRDLWQQALAAAGTGLNGQVDAIVEQFDFGPTRIAHAVAAAQERAALHSSGNGAILTDQDLWEACREQSGPQLGELAQRITPCYDWDDIVLPKDVLVQLQEIAAQVANRPQVYQTWGFGAKLNRGRGISALFSGPSGVGKTMAAEVLARHLKLDLYRIDLAGVVSKYIGETEKNLRRVFDAAERSGAILFFDEADALFGKRSEVKDSHDRYANIEVNYLLQRMEDYRGLAILATNMKSFLDAAFLRRLRFIVDFPFPGPVQRQEIWRRVFPPAAAVRGLDFGVLSRLEIPGGNIRNIAVNAAFLAAGEGVPIDMEHVMRAARREYTKIERLIMDAEFGRYAGARTQ
jgi:ATP-dependent 26S proteasome regulatory subunit